VQTLKLHLVLAHWLLASSAAVPCYSSLAVACSVSAQSRCDRKVGSALPLVAFASSCPLSEQVQEMVYPALPLLVFASSCPLSEEVQEMVHHQCTASLATSDDVPSFSCCRPATETYCERWCTFSSKWGVTLR
jgi:hypothetical protein